MATVTVRVIPKAGKTAVTLEDRGVVVRVRAAPEGGRATEEARRALAAAVGVPAAAVTLRIGARGRIKVFEIDGIGPTEVTLRLRATPPR